MDNDKKNNNNFSSLNAISKSTNVAFNILFLILALMSIIPVIFVFMVSISSEASLATQGYQFIPKSLGFSAYEFLWGEKKMILKALSISVIVTTVGTVIGVALTSAMGYVLSRPAYKLRSFFTWVIFIPMIFNGGLVASYVINTNLLRLKDSIWVLILPLCVSSFNIIICRTFFQTTIPDSVVESTQIDGASQWTIFFRIVLPISKPVLATISLFLMFGYWNDWFLSAVYINNKDLISLQALLNNMQQNILYLANNPSAGLSMQQYQNLMPVESVRMAIAIVIIIPIALAYPFFQKFFISGLTIGAVKG